jgi:hypothetical protein
VIWLQSQCGRQLAAIERNPAHEDSFLMVDESSRKPYITDQSVSNLYSRQEFTHSAAIRHSPSNRDAYELLATHTRSPHGQNTRLARHYGRCAGAVGLQ